jgi:hypothetical protein
VTEEDQILGWRWNAADHHQLCCMKCNSQWCEHALDEVKNRRDVKHLQTRLQIARDESEKVLIIDVPMFSNGQMDCAVFIDLERRNKAGAHKVYANTDIVDAEFIGWLNKSDGIDAIRYMVYGWLEDRSRDHLLGSPCKSQRHGLVQEQAWKNAMTYVRTDTYRMRQMLSILTTGQCLECSQGATTINFDDLVPEVEKPTWAGK